MIDGIRLKTCGLTALVDAEFVDRAGADALGFILYPKSPRHISLLQYKAMAPRLPEGRKRVAVMVEPSAAELAEALEAGFDFFQIHFDPANVPVAAVAAWSQAVGPKRLWLAPKLPPGAEVGGELLPLADTFLIDTFHADGFGGTGRTGDWAGFARQQAAHPEKTWILAGGLNAENITAALTESGAKFVDVNSGVELAPGVKDHVKVRQFVVAIHRARTKE
ncbi:MAG TPA: phosphoribosylanthranilate isomerase [Rariglobus sp.]|jgi:phosphoribosylanthranilate isomerase|nr:phosphoribosylanthranilate isomerase [Rariglobus sp.]